MVSSFTEVIDKFDGPAAFGRAIGMKPNAAKQARRRGRIASEWFTAVAQAAETRGFHDITIARLAELAAERRAA